MSESDGDAALLPLCRVQASLSQITEVSLPHHLDLLRQHRANILRHCAGGAWRAARAEQARAGRVCVRLRALLSDAASVRARLAHADRAAFDQCTRRAREDTLAAIVDYLGAIERGCRALAAGRGPGPGARAGPRRDTAGAGDKSCPQPEPEPPAAPAPGDAARGEGGEEEQGAGEGVSEAPLGGLQLVVDPHAGVTDDALGFDGSGLREREAVLRGWGELAREVHALHGVWQHVQAAAIAQRLQVSAVSSAVDSAGEHTAAAASHLAAAERLRGVAVCGAGALVGAVLCGPLGLVVGAKAGAAAALAGSALGFLGARRVARQARGQGQLDAEPAPATPSPHGGKQD